MSYRVLNTDLELRAREAYHIASNTIGNNTGGEAETENRIVHFAGMVLLAETLDSIAGILDTAVSDMRDRE